MSNTANHSIGSALSGTTSNCECFASSYQFRVNSIVHTNTHDLAINFSNKREVPRIGDALLIPYG